MDCGDLLHLIQREAEVAMAGVPCCETFHWLFPALELGRIIVNLIPYQEDNIYSQALRAQYSIFLKATTLAIFGWIR